MVPHSADEPVPAPDNEAPAPDATTTDEPVATAPGDELTQLASAAQKGRLSVAEEERTTALLKEALLGGRAGVARAVEMLPALPWLAGVRAVEAAWAELTAGFRTQLLSGLAKIDSDAARRTRASLARALFKIEAPVGLKIAVGLVKDMHDKEADGIAQKDAQILSNVFIGRARPWIAQVPLAELKPAEGDLLVHLTVLAAFTLPHPPLTQLAILKWAQENDRLDKLRESALAAVTTGVGRWNGKWQGVLRNEIANLPESISSALQAASSESARQSSEQAGETDAAIEGESAGGEPQLDRPPRRERPVYVSREEEARLKALEEGGGEMPVTDATVEPPENDDRDEDADEDSEDDEERPPRDPQDARPPRESRDRRERDPRQQQGRGTPSFNVTQALRQIESHVHSLRAELDTARTKLRNREADGQRAKRKPDVVVVEGEPTPEELARLNLQLEARNAELQARIEELTQNAEDVAVASGAVSDQPVADPDAQLRTLLELKLQEDHADFVALEEEGNDVVVQQHYRTLIRHIFEVLVAQGVKFGAE